VQGKGLAELSAVCFYHRGTHAHVCWIDGQARHFSFQFTRPEMRFVQILKVLRAIPPLTPHAVKGSGGIERFLFIIRAQASVHVIIR